MDSEILDRLENGGNITDAELSAMIEWTDRFVFLELCRRADRVRDCHMGPEVYLRGLIEFSNVCRNNCLYCGIRAENAHVKRYRMSPEEIVETAKGGQELGYGTIVLQSGEDPYFTGPMLAEIIRSIKKLGLAVTLSIGEREPEEYRLWREAGADRYLLRHETADPELYDRLNPGMTLEHRIGILKYLKTLGYQVGAGFMVGLPGQTTASLVADLRLIKDLDVEMVGIGPFIANPETPLAGCSSGTMEKTLTMVALARMMVPQAHIPATTALGSIDPSGREKALQAGANIVMPNLTPVCYREDYQLYPGKICLSETADVCKGCLTGRIESIGRCVGKGPGHSPKEAWKQEAGGV